MRGLIFIFVVLCCKVVCSQQQTIEEDENYSASQLEDLSQDEDAESENDYDLQQLAHYRNHPLNINSQEIDELPLLDPMLIENLNSYRRLLGDIIDIHELQAVPGFSVEIIKRIIPFVIVKMPEATTASLSERFTKGVHSLLMRFSFTPEKAAGFAGTASTNKKFEGTRPAIFARYKYQYRNLMQFGIVTDKDPGEKMFVKGPLPDFITVHFFARQIGSIKSIALGDYTINLGQGLIHWQSQAFKKSSSVLNIKRQSEALKPYQSAGEYNFHRGVAATFEKRKWQSTIFLSLRKLSANVDQDLAGQNIITSVQTSGLHRTESENTDRNALTSFSAGGNIRKILRSAQIGINGVFVRYSLPVEKQDAPYNFYAIAGRMFLNTSADFSYTYRNLHLFGEFACNRNWSKAFVGGVMASLSGSVDVAVLYRDINKSYNSIYGNAFTENTTPSNEKGFYSGISLKPFTAVRIDLYADLFSFPWLKYRLAAPSDGVAYLLQVTVKPNRRTEIYSRYRYRIKPLDIDYEEDNIPGQEVISHWRTQFSYNLNPNLLIRSRVELCIYNHRFLAFPSTGYLFFTEVHYKPFSSWVSGSVRFQAFEAENYNTRIYAYENDLLFVSSTPSFYNNGVKCYLNVKGKFRVKGLSNKSLTISLKVASTIYTNISSIGTGLSAITGARSSSLKLQFFLTK